jgi:hypothetical protein
MHNDTLLNILNELKFLSSRFSESTSAGYLFYGEKRTLERTKTP